MSTTETQGSATTEAAKKVQIAADDGVNCPEVGDVVAAMDWSHAEERRIILKSVYSGFCKDRVTDPKSKGSTAILCLFCS